MHVVTIIEDPTELRKIIEWALANQVRGPSSEVSEEDPKSTVHSDQKTSLPTDNSLKVTCIRR
jgi:hypothetical protein